MWEHVLFIFMLGGGISSYCFRGGDVVGVIFIGVGGSGLFWVFSNGGGGYLWLYNDLFENYSFWGLAVFVGGVHNWGVG